MDNITRQCPACDKKIIYSNKYKRERADAQNSKCRSCSKKGNNAPWFGKYKENHPNYNKKMSTEEKKKRSIKMTGDYNPMFGKKPHNFGKHHTIESKIKNSIAHKGEKNYFFGKSLSEEHKLKIRLSKLKRLKETYGQISPYYNPIACEIFNQISKEKNINIQHAENGGEFHIKELGFWVDGYDKENNTIYEYDEKHHFDMYGNLKEKDIKRQQLIKDYLKCQVVRINYNQTIYY